MYFVGGVAANGANKKALDQMLTERNGHHVQSHVPEDYLYIEAIGSALLSRDKKAQPDFSLN